MDDLFKGEDGRGIWKLVAGFLGSIGGVKVVSSIINKLAERRINLDKYRHEEADKFAEREAERSKMLEGEIRRLNDILTQERELKWDAKNKLSITEQRLESQILQNSELCEDIETLRQRIAFLEAALNKTHQQP